MNMIYFFVNLYVLIILSSCEITVDKDPNKWLKLNNFRTCCSLVNQTKNYQHCQKINRFP